ncbi:Protein-tyrosine phosphatase [Teladorsagia circumcincta]|uniref:Protein-tyrosine phosphatase n=1 Tax=Teladorsagia circumcincta TaxID=45464 RepID=A0A2G9V0Z1_TELCI|nr:Protein-tyrosine phosphatase [Teladorsagia circumcincta]
MTNCYLVSAVVSRNWLSCCHFHEFSKKAIAGIASDVVPSRPILKGRPQSLNIMVHCSAGVGRSGTFMALEMCLQDLANGLPINVNQVIVCLRRCRALAVQTFEQYLAIHRAILSVGEKHGVIMKVMFLLVNQNVIDFSVTD